jgi:tetratricopeptide (TPR) repeat protein
LEFVKCGTRYIKAQDRDLATILTAGAMLITLDPPELKQEGLKLFEHAVALSPRSVDARLALASTLCQIGEVQRAQKLYREVLEMHPNEVQALNNLAWILQEREQQYGTALELANRGLRLAPDNLDLLDTRGTILSNLPGRLSAARSDFEELVRRLSSDAPRQAKALLQLGRVCAALGELPEAKQHVTAALEIDRQLGIFDAEERAKISEILRMQPVPDSSGAPAGGGK